MTAISWVVLTQGQRPEALHDAVESLLRNGAAFEVVVWCNGCSPGDVAPSLPTDDRIIVRGGRTELGVPGGRDRALRTLDTSAWCVGFLDDDARLLTDDAGRSILNTFDSSEVGAVALRLVDEDGVTARRHVPRPGPAGADVGGEVATFLGGACAVRRSAYVDVGGYWSELWYGHEELELAWRLVDAGCSIVYRPDVVVFHPRTPISRHELGWSRTGRNRVLVARRSLPRPLSWVHALVWLVAGVVRAPAECRASYLGGWWSGWRIAVTRRPVSWATVGRLSRLGRPPVI